MAETLLDILANGLEYALQEIDATQDINGTTAVLPDESEYMPPYRAARDALKEYGRGGAKKLEQELLANTPAVLPALVQAAPQGRDVLKALAHYDLLDYFTVEEDGEGDRVLKNLDTALRAVHDAVYTIQHAQE